MKKDFLLIVAIYLLACLGVMPYVKWYVDNPDSLQYINIAHHILDGRLTLAINGYWSPLITWFLAPFILIFNDGIIAFKYLQMAIGVFVIRKWLIFLVFVDVEEKWKRVLGFVIFPFIVSYSLLNLTPDLLFVGILFALIIELIRWLDKQTDGSSLGKLGALLFLTKSFGLPLFIFLFCFVIWMKDERIPKITLKKILLPFGTVAGLWIILLSIKYGKFTISESAKFNFTYEVAPTVGKTVQLPVLGNGLLEPSNDFALSAWEEPASQIQLTPLDPFGDIAYYFNVVNRNLQSIYFHDFRNQLGWVFIFFLIIYLFRKKSDDVIPLWIKISLLVICALYIGYSLILVHERYIWICTLLFIPMIVFFIDKIFASFPSSKISEIKKIQATKRISEIKLIILIPVLILCIKRPAKEVLMCGDRDVNILQLYHAFRSPIETMNIFYRPDEKLHDDIQKLKRIIPPNSNLASIKKADPERDGYASTLLIAYECKSKYFGQTFEVDSTFKGYFVSWKAEAGEKVFDSDGGVKVYLK
ncbi:MAG: hypothetical protein IPI10_07425 [Bacteroidetes bacterium]|nr:hypothetical protein [Bacteroidota bacterium]